MPLCVMMSMVCEWEELLIEVKQQIIERSIINDDIPLTNESV